MLARSIRDHMGFKIGSPVASWLAGKRVTIKGDEKCNMDCSYREGIYYELETYSLATVRRALGLCRGWSCQLVWLVLFS